MKKDEEVKVVENKSMNSENPISSDKGHEKIENRFKKYFSGFTLMIIVNILSFGITLFFVLNLNAKALELKRIKNELVNADKISSAQLVESEIGQNNIKSDFVLSLFPDDSGLIKFISEIDKAKTRGVINDFYFANQDAVKDETGNYGIPFVLSMKGTWSQIDLELTELQKLQYIVRTITFKTKVVSGDVVTLDYGGFIYVNQSLGKTK